MAGHVSGVSLRRNFKVARHARELRFSPVSLSEKSIVAICLVAAEKDSTNMAKNYLHEGWTIAVPAPTGGVHSGDPILDAVAIVRLNGVSV